MNTPDGNQKGSPISGRSSTTALSNVDKFAELAHSGNALAISVPRVPSQERRCGLPFHVLVVYHDDVTLIVDAELFTRHWQEFMLVFEC